MNESKDNVGLKGLWKSLFHPRRNQFRHLSPKTVARLSGVAIVGIWMMFLVESLLSRMTGESPLWVDIGRAILLIVSVAAGALATLSTTWFVNSTDDMNIDERETHERNRATVISYRYLMGLLTFGMLVYHGSLILRKFTDDGFLWTPSLEITNYFVASVFLTGILLPTFVMAALSWSQTEPKDES